MTRDAPVSKASCFETQAVPESVVEVQKSAGSGSVGDEEGGLITIKDAINAYFEEKEPKEWTLEEFLIECRDKVGDARFYSSDFGTWRARYLNKIRWLITRYETTEDVPRRNEATDALNAPHAQAREAKATFDAGAEVAEDKAHIRDYTKVVFESRVADQICTLKKRKRPQVYAKTPDTPGHEEWATVFSKAREEPLPHYRLSMPAAERSRARLSVTENSLIFLQAYVRRQEGVDRAANKDFGDLAVHVARNLSRYQFAHPPHDGWLDHVLSLGRALRNSPVHVLEGGFERVPWDSDFVICARSAGYAAFVSTLRDVDECWTGAEDDHVDVVRKHLWRSCVVAAITMRHRVGGSAAVIPATSGRDELARLGVVPWAHLSQLITKFTREAETELYDVLRNDIRVRVSNRTIAAMLRQLSQLPRKDTEPYLRLYGGTKVAMLESMIAFARNEEAARDPTDVEPIERALVLLSPFLELFVTLRTRNSVLEAHFKEWEELIVGFANQVGLDEVEAEFLAKDAEYKKRRTGGENLDQEPAASVDDPFVSGEVGKVSSGDLNVKGGILVAEGLSSMNAGGEVTSSQAREDQELLQLRARLKELQEKKRLRDEIARLEKELKKED